jgi:hypothetical protein
VAAVLAACRGDVVQHRRRRGADVDDVEAGGGQPADEGGDEARSRRAAVAPDGNGALAGSDGFGAERAAEMLREGLVDRLADDAADVVGLEDARMGVHGSGGGCVRVRAIVGTAPRHPAGASQASRRQMSENGESSLLRRP